MFSSDMPQIINPYPFPIIQASPLIGAFCSLAGFGAPKPGQQTGGPIKAGETGKGKVDMEAVSELDVNTFYLPSIYLFIVY